MLALKNTLELIGNKEIKLVDYPIFIVGCGHSVTSLMLAILDHHPSIYGIDYENNIFLKVRPLLLPLELLKVFKNGEGHAWKQTKSVGVRKHQGIFYIFLKYFFVIQTAGSSLCLEMGET